MAIGVVGRKLGMTRLFTEEGVSIPVTVIEVVPNQITQLKTVERDGYRAIQVTTGYRKPSRLNRPEKGIFAKARVEPGRGLWEFRLEDGEGKDLQPGQAYGVEIFQEGQFVDVTGTTIGRGFAGTIRRHGFRRKPMSHGCSVSHRTPGSIGQCQDPGRVFPGKRMPGRMGGERRTVQNLKVMAVDRERGLLFVKGAVPGHKGSDLIVRPAVKKRKVS